MGLYEYDVSVESMHISCNLGESGSNIRIKGENREEIKGKI